MPAIAFDWKETLRLSNNKEDLAKTLVKILAKDLPVLRHDLNQALKKEDIDTIYHLAHKFYGACCYCSVPKLKPLLQQLEANSKTQAAHEQKALIKAIDLEIQKILTSLKQYL
jgi:two-component system, NarL family, sensor histidine kinase BarA